MNAARTDLKLKPSERIIIALDVDTRKRAIELVDELGDSVGAFKIGLQLFTAAGPEFVREIVEKGHRVFLDLKFHDIPNTVAKAAVEAARLGVWMFNVHALGGGEMMRRTIEEVDEICVKENLTRPKIIAVTVLTSSDANELREIGIEKDVSKVVVNLAQLAAKCGLDGVVASAHETDAVKRSTASEKFLVVTPGIRPSSATNDDQKRVMTAARAVKSGSDYVVIGRPITEAKNKRAAVTAIIKEIETTF